MPCHCLCCRMVFLPLPACSAPRLAGCSCVILLLHDPVVCNSWLCCIVPSLKSPLKPVDFLMAVVSIACWCQTRCSKTQQRFPLASCKILACDYFFFLSYVQAFSNWKPGKCTKSAENPIVVLRILAILNFIFLNKLKDKEHNFTHFLSLT